MLSKLKSFEKLWSLYNNSKDTHMKELFAKDSNRANKYFLEVGGIKVDYSKNRIDDEILNTLIDLAKEANLEQNIKDMFSGKKINTTENRAALHIALRNRINTPIYVDNENIMDDVNAVLNKMEKFSHAVRSGEWLGYTNQVITDIVNIGIGGSDLGPLMACDALKKYAHPRLKMHFVSNVDGSKLQNVLDSVHPETTLFIIASKTFVTQETLTNALTAREWFLNHAVNKRFVAKHFVAVSTNKKAVEEFGIDSNNMFEFWNWVGGRYSLWSAIGLPIMIYLGKEHFWQMLEGAYLMDSHFSSAEYSKNLPVILALIGIWYINFYGGGSHIIAPYDEYLKHFPRFIQQLDMESNGKQVSKNGELINYETSPIIWGETGINAQHAFFQLLHQGTHISPIDLIVSLEKPHDMPEHHEILISNVFAQAEAFMKGKTKEEVRAELKQSNLSDSEIEKLIPHKEFSGNRPSNTILLERISPRNLGSLIALYEHKIFVQGVIWGINSFDQFGVELGKTLAKTILEELRSDISHEHDSSTTNLIKLYKDFNKKS